MKRRFIQRNSIGGAIDPDEILADSVSALETRWSPEGKLERPLGRLASLFFLMMVLGGLSYLASRAATLQVRNGDSFFSESQENRFLIRPIFPARGIVYDQWDTALVENRPSFGIFFSRDEFLTMVEPENADGELRNVIRSLGEILNVPEAFFFEAGFPEDYSVSALPAQLIVHQGLTPESIVSLSPKVAPLFGVAIFEGSRRVYSNSAAFSHVLGFVGKASNDDLARRKNLLSGEVVGKSGVELEYDELLRGRGGRKIVETDAVGGETRYKLIEAASEGLNLELTVDGEFQETIHSILQAYTGGKKNASVVAIDPRSGAVRALVSYPSFDANRFGSSLSQSEFETIINNPLKPLFNRAISGEYPSGSTIKPMMAAAVLEEHVIDPLKKIFSAGFISLPNPFRPGEESVFVDWKAHGWVNMYEAIAVSSNIYFYTVGGGFEDQKGLGIERIAKYARQFGLGSVLGIDLPGESSGLIPDPEWKKAAMPQDPLWRIGDTYNVSIGQGGVKVTPLQMASLTATIANGGTIWKPHVLDAIVNKNGTVVEKKNPEILRDNIIRSDVLSDVRRGMRLAVTNGTAWRLSSLPVASAGKTGTAQPGGKQLPHAWVIAYAPVVDPELAIAVLVENAGEGSTVATPITHDILNWYFSNRKNGERVRALPSLPGLPVLSGATTTFVLPSGLQVDVPNVPIPNVPLAPAP